MLVSGRCSLLAVVFFFPMVWMVLSSFKTNSEIFSAPFALPTAIDFGRWVEAWEVGHLGSYALNSAIVTGVSVTLILIFGAGAAFAFSRYRFRGRGLVDGPVRARACCCRSSRYFIAQSKHVHAAGASRTRASR